MPSSIAPFLAIVTSRTEPEATHRLRTLSPCHQLIHPIALTRPASPLDKQKGSQCAAEAYQKQLAAIDAKPSMSRKGCYYDHAPMEPFFHTLKGELVHQRQWTTREEAKRDLFAYIEAYYNRARIHSALGYTTPEQAERLAS